MESYFYFSQRCLATITRKAVRKIDPYGIKTVNCDLCNKVTGQMDTYCTAAPCLFESKDNESYESAVIHPIYNQTYRMHFNKLYIKSSQGV